MIQEQERAEKFFRAIRRDASRRRKEITEQIDAYIAAETEKADAEAQRTADDRVKYESDRIQAQTNSRLAKATTETSAHLAACRNEITRQVFDQAKAKLLAYVQTPDYLTWLSQSFDSMASMLGAGMTVYVCPRDLSALKKLQAEKGVDCQLQADENIVIGGLRAENNAKTADDTLDGRLADQEDWFFQNAGLSIAIQ